MGFHEKYTNTELKEPKKTEISNEAYAIGELLDDIRRRLEILGRLA